MWSFSDPTWSRSCTTSLRMLIRENLLWGFNILRLFHERNWTLFPDHQWPEKQCEPHFTRLWGTAWSGFPDFYAIVYHVLLRTVSLIIYDFKKYSIDTARGSGGGRGRKNISMVVILPLPHWGHISGSYLRCCLQTSFQCFFSLTSGILIPKANWSFLSSPRRAVESNP